MPAWDCADDAEGANGSRSLDANMCIGLDEASEGSGGIRTKCRISAAEVPT